MKHECEFYLITDVAVHVCECGNITVSDKSESKEYVEESKCAELIAALERCHIALQTYGEHPLIDSHVKSLISKHKAQ